MGCLVHELGIHTSLCLIRFIMLTVSRLYHHTSQTYLRAYHNKLGVYVSVLTCTKPRARPVPPCSLLL